ncbi:MAG: DUF92 domain-containing protein [Candidatus Cybelea sp.]|jgi:uncharacterized protein (TIGR00297 family)
MQVAIGVVLAAAVALVAYRARALSRSGAIAAFLVGAMVFGAGGWPGAAVLLAFFVPSSLLSRIGKARKRAIGEGIEPEPRNGWQVLANGGIAAVCVLAEVHGGARFAAAFAGAFAAASADTWGTEIGILSRRAPVSLLTLRPVAAGRSGGVTVLGLAASIAGALLVAGIAALLGLASLWSVTAGGIAGALLDSLLGGSLQALRWCPQCRCDCETRMHACGAVTELRRGTGWIENDAVNFAATLCGAAVAGLLAS